MLDVLEAPPFLTTQLPAFTAPVQLTVPDFTVPVQHTAPPLFTVPVQLTVVWRLTEGALRRFRVLRGMDQATLTRHPPILRVARMDQLPTARVAMEGRVLTLLPVGMDHLEDTPAELIILRVTRDGAWIKYLHSVIMYVEIWVFSFVYKATIRFDSYL